MMKGMIAIACCTAMLAACAAKKQEPRPEPMPTSKATAPAPAMPSGSGEQTLTVNAKVVGVNHKTRHVTLKGEDGKTFTIVAGPDVRNLAQVKKGDHLRVTYTESIAYQVAKAGTAQPGVSTSTDVSRAPLGEKPSGTVKDTVNVRATIAAIDKAGSHVTLRGPAGRMTTVKVKDPSKLDMVQVGDVVDITYTEALAIAVEKPGKKK